MVITHSLRKRFIKDYRLPISILEDPYFDYFVELYSHMNAREKYDRFVALVERLGGEEQFFSESKRIIHEMIDSIQGHDLYDSFRQASPDPYKTAHSFGNKSPIFIEGSSGHWFTSIDLVKANWQSLSFWNAGIVNNAASYEEWAGQFTNEEYYLKSKQIRQVVFGKLNPKRQQVIQRYMMDQVLHRLDKATLVKFNVIGTTSDEVTIMWDKKPKQAKLDYIRAVLPRYYDLHVDTFQLHRIGDKSFYKREYLDGSFDLKGVPTHYYPEVLQHVLGNETNQMDRMSLYDGRVVQFVRPLFE